LYCSNCGKEVPEEAAFCPNCGFPQRGIPIQLQRRRPTGVSIISILGMIFGVLGVLSGVGIFLAAFAISWVSEYSIPNYTLSPEVLTALSPFFYGLGAVVLSFSVLMFIAAYGLFNGNRWGWHIALFYLVISLGTSGIFDVKNIVAFLPYMAVEGVIFGLLILYLTRPRVKTYFGDVKANIWLMILIFAVTLVASNVLWSMTVSNLEQLFLPLTAI